MLFNTEGNLGNGKHHNGHNYSGSEGDSFPVRGYVNWTDSITNKRPRHKMETKAIIVFLFDLLGIGIGGHYIITKIDNVKEAILFIILLCYAICRFYIRVRRDHVLLRKELLEQLQREKDFKKTL